MCGSDSTLLIKNIDSRLILEEKKMKKSTVWYAVVLLACGLFFVFLGGQSRDCVDNDRDGYAIRTCGSGEECGPIDCDDTDANVNPGVEESLEAGNCSDGVDNDCDGLADLDDECEMVPILEAIEEASARSMDPDANFDDFELLIQNYTDIYSRGYVRFDISAIPATATVTEARVELYYCNCDGIDDIAVYAAADAWSAATLTWNNQPGTTGPALDVVNLNPDFLSPPYSCGDTGEYVASAGGMASKEGWFITDLVQAWVDGSEQNHGIVFMAYPEEANPDPPGKLGAAFGIIEDTGNCPGNPSRLTVKYK